jgi:starch-binding outer membrane protein, SusD/RagB family
MKKARYFLFLTLAILLTSCGKDFLDLKPLDVEVSTNFYQTEEDIFRALVAVYDAATYQALPGGAWAPLPTIPDILSDDAYAGGSDANDGLEHNELNAFQISTTNTLVRTLWANPYIGIYRANLMMELIEPIQMDSTLKQQYVAEAKFFRAYFYFQLAQYFENVPLLTKNLSGPSEYAQEQTPVDLVYNQIARDLIEAAEILPTIRNSGELGRVTKWAAKSLLGRVFLFYNGVYGENLVVGEKVINSNEALLILEEVIQESGHDLLPDYSHNFRLVGEFGKESIFEISYGDSPIWWDWGYVRGGNGNLAAQMQGPRVSGSIKWNRGWSFAPVSHKLYEDLKSDPRMEYTILREEEIDGSLAIGYQHTGYFSKKYSSDAEHWGSGGQFELNRTCNFRVIRFADVLLMAAELGSSNAQEYLDRVRSRVGLSSIPATKDNILKERRLELSLEGLRYFDLLRQGQDVAERELTKNNIRGPKYVGDQQLFNTSYNSNTLGFLPIPQNEIDLSGGKFKQNRGY